MSARCVSVQGSLIIGLGYNLGQIIHDSKIDWLELNETGRKLLFRDKRSRLNLVDVDSLTKTSIMNYCTFVQWVPGSDVVVAQSRDNMGIWYNIDAPEKVTLLAIKGDVVDIGREDGKTEVFVQEGQHQLSYELDEGNQSIVYTLFLFIYLGLALAGQRSSSR